MGRYLEQYDKDYMRMAMLKQEETFRHQVTELHRLYRVQKVLMNDMKAAENKRQMSPSNPRTELERWNCRNTDSEMASSPPKPARCGYSCHDKRRPPCRALDLELDVDNEEEEECGLELTLATGSKSTRRRKEAENSFTSDSGASLVSSSSTESGSRAKLSGGGEWGVLFHVPDISCQRERNKSTAFDVEEEMLVKQPPWLFHCSSPNLT